MKKILAATLLLTWIGINPALAEVLQGPALGQPISEDDLVRWDIGVMPDGAGLPEGSGSVTEGKIVYQQKCLVCHGEGGVGNSADQLAGAINQLTDEWPEKTIGIYWPYVTTLFDFTRRSMPMTQPGSLTDDETYAVVAYVLFLNNLLDENAVMDEELLRQFEMPNKNGFIDIYQMNQKSQR